jgi:hypothetical protein
MIDYITRPQAERLKKLGFDEPCFKYVYTGDTGNNVDRYLEVKPSLAKNFNDDSLCISIPLLQQVFKWSLENYWYWFRPDLYDETRTDFSGSIHILGRFTALCSFTCESIDELHLVSIETLIELMENENR